MKWDELHELLLLDGTPNGGTIPNQIYSIFSGMQWIYYSCYESTEGAV